MNDYKELQNGSDIRGVAMDGIEGQCVNLTAAAAGDLTYGFALWLSTKTGKKVSELSVAIGMDTRLSGPKLLSICSETLVNLGVTVFDAGVASTPAMFMSTIFNELWADGAIMITASHLPFNRNGFKYFWRQGGLDKRDIKDIVAKAEAGFRDDGSTTQKGRLIKKPLMDIYAAHLRDLICKGLGSSEKERPLEGLHIAVDAGNGAGGFYAKDVLLPLGANIEGSQFLDHDGMFPNHQPNPENAEAMDSISSAVLKSHADLGVIFDTDVDRFSAVFSSGEEIARNALVALAAALIADEHPGTTIVTDSITSTQLTAFLTEHLGLKHLRYMRGYRNVINKALDINAAEGDAQLAIETSGHAAFKENYFLDDGAYLATKMIVKAALLKREGKDIAALTDDLEEPLEAAEFRLPVLAEDFSAYADAVLAELTTLISQGECDKEHPCNGRCRCGMTIEKPNYEGIRVNVDKENGDGWFLLRKSLHDPLMPLNIESNSKGGVAVIAKHVKALLAKHGDLDISTLDRA